MYHRNYTTYLQKELDFLKLLVARFHEQEKVNGLELDIALQKTQEVYEQLLRMKLGFEGDEKIIPDKTTDMPIAIAVTEKKITEPVRQPEPPQKEPSVPIVEEPKPEPPKKEPVIVVEEPKPEPPKKESIPVAVEPSIPIAEEPKPEQVAIEKPEEVVFVAEEKIKEPIPAREEKQQPAEPVKSGILAEKIGPSDFHPINETLAQKTGDLSSKLQTAPLSSIVAGIGLNDKFLYIRELFKGDNALYSNTIRHLDTAESLGDAMDFINHHFDWDKKDETTQKFMNLVHRRHGS